MRLIGSWLTKLCCFLGMHTWGGPYDDEPCIYCGEDCEE